MSGVAAGNRQYGRRSPPWAISMVSMPVTAPCWTLRASWQAGSALIPVGGRVYSPHPRVFFRPDDPPFRLMSG